MRAAVLLAVLLLPGLARAAAPWAAIEVAGDPPGARGAAQDAAGAWSRTAGPGEGLEGLVSAVGAALIREGWGQGTIEARVDSVPGGARCRVTLRGIAPTRLSSWTWSPPVENGSIDAGVWDPSRGEEELQRILENVQEQGHPFASIQIGQASDSAGAVVVRARLDEGPELRLIAPIFEGRGGTRASYLERVSGLKRGEPIRPSLAMKARDRVERTGLFAEVAGPWLRGVQEPGASLVYRLTPLPQNRVEGAVGYEGQRQTLSGFAHVELGNLFGTGRKLDAAWEHLDRNRSSLNLSYREPFLLNLPVAAEVSLAQQLEDTTWTSDQARASLVGDLGGGLAVRLGVSSDRTVASGPLPSRTRRTATIAGIEIDDRADSGTRGSRLALEVTRGTLHRSPRLSEGEGSLTTVSIQDEQNLLFGSHGHIHAELSAGWVAGPDSLPRPDAIGLGGAATLRGYPEQAFRVLRFGLGRLEAGVRILPEGNRAYVFVDGALFRPWPAGATERRTGYGVGVRVRGGGGWVRLDYGIPSGQSPLSGRIHFRLETRF